MGFLKAIGAIGKGLFGSGGGGGIAGSLSGLAQGIGNTINSFGSGISGGAGAPGASGIAGAAGGVVNSANKGLAGVAETVKLKNDIKKAINPVGHMRKLGKAQKAYEDQLYPGTSVWSRIGTGGAGGVVGSIESAEAGMRSSRIGAKGSIESSRIGARAPNRMAALAEEKLEAELSKLQTEIDHTHWQAIKGSQEAFENDLKIAIMEQTGRPLPDSVSQELAWRITKYDKIEDLFKDVISGDLFAGIMVAGMAAGALKLPWVKAFKSIADKVRKKKKIGF